MTQAIRRNALTGATAQRPASLRRLAAMTVVVAATALSGCAQYATLEPMTPAAGINVDQANAKLRALVIIADAAGNGVITGAVVSSEDDVITSITGTADATTMEPDGELTAPEATVQTPAGEFVSLTSLSLQVSSPQLKPGLTAQLTFTFEKAGDVTVTVPVLDASHPDFSTVTPGN